MALSQSSILIHGDEAKPYDLSEHLLPGRPSVLLYPSDDAIVLSSEFAKSLGPINLVVPDGNWRQTSKMRRRNQLMAEMPTIRLPPGAPSMYRVRRESKAEGLATIEAIARTLGYFEGAAVQVELEKILENMVERTMRSRGTPLSQREQPG
jgi:DTW domain-containing protein YfiP